MVSSRQGKAREFVGVCHRLDRLVRCGLGYLPHDVELTINEIMLQALNRLSSYKLAEASREARVDFLKNSPATSQSEK